MNRVAIVAILFSSIAVAQATPTPLNGTWKVHSKVKGSESNFECTFIQTGSGLAGSCTTDKDPVKLTGKVNGNKVAWSYESNYKGISLTLLYDGTLIGDKITGGEKVQPFSVPGEFTATRSK